MIQYWKINQENDLSTFFILKDEAIWISKIKKKHIERFGHKIAELLESEMPQIKTATGLSKIYGISFMH